MIEFASVRPLKISKSQNSDGNLENRDNEDFAAFVRRSLKVAAQLSRPKLFPQTSAVTTVNQERDSLPESPDDRAVFPVIAASSTGFLDRATPTRETGDVE